MRPMLVALVLLVQHTTDAQSDLILRVGDAPPELDFSVIKGNTDVGKLNWERLTDQVVVIDFWATWCTPCIKAIPELNRLVEEFANKPVTFLSITYEPEHMVLPFLAKHPINTIVGSDNDFAMFKSFKAWGIPMVVLVNADRRIAAIIHPEHLNAWVINEVLAGNTPDIEPARGWKDPEGADKYFRSLVAKKGEEK